MNGTEKPFLEFFNAADHDIIPAFVKESCNIASKWILMRFLFIELWNLKILLTFGQINESYYKTKISKIWKMLDDIRTCNEQPTIVIGKYEEYEISRKGLIGMSKTSGIKYFPMLPNVIIKKNGSLRYL